MDIDEFNDDPAESLDAFRAAPQTSYESLRMRHQVDLNDSRLLGDLEDPALVEHMNEARDNLCHILAKQDELPDIESLRSSDTEVRKQLSGLMVSLSQSKLDLRIAIDDLALHSSNAAKLAQSVQPHSYPSHKDSDKCFALLGERIRATGEEITKILAELEMFEKSLTLVRRTYENAMVGFTKTIENM